MAPARRGSASRRPSGDDAVLEVLGDVVDALKENTERTRWMLARAEVIRSKRESGKSYREIAADGEPLIITRVTENLQNLVNAGSRLRRAHARALYAEGATLQEIGKLFGVSHQRISAIIHSSDEDAPGRGRPRRGR